MKRRDGFIPLQIILLVVHSLTVVIIENGLNDYKLMIGVFVFPFFANTLLKSMNLVPQQPV